MEFTLPPLTQESFSRWHNKKVPRNDSIDERIVYPGIKLNCSTKARDLRSNIMPCHVFITHIIDTDTFHHKVLGSNNVFASLPKRLYSHCFRNINIHSIPQNNRIVVRLTENTDVILPYIPDDFVVQKRSKRNSSSKTKHKRPNKRTKKDHNQSQKDYQGWVTMVMAPATEEAADNGINSFQLLNYIKSELRSYDQKLNVSIPNPFAGTQSIEQINKDPEKLKALTIIVQFAHHYAKHLMY